MDENKTKKLIRKTAIALFKEKGYDKVTIQDICQNSNISKHTFYYHFESKEALLKTLTKSPIDITPEMISKIMLSESPYEQYCEILKVAINHFEDSGKDLMRKILVAQLTSSFDQEPADDKKHIIGIMVGLISKAQKKGEIKNQAEPMELLQASFCLMIGVSQIWTTHTHHEFGLDENYFKLLAVLMQSA